MDGTNSLKSIQMALVIFITQTGVGVIRIPTELSKEVGHDGWISVLLTGMLVVALTYMIVLLMRRYKDKSIYEINSYIYGKVIGTFFNSIIILYFLVLIVCGTSLFNYFIRITLLQDTPAWVLAPFITLPSFYLVWQGLKSMSRFLYCSMLVYIIIILFSIVLIKEYRLTFILPVGEAGIIKILYSIKRCFFAFIGFETIVFFYPYISDKKNTMKWSILAILLSTVFFTLVVLIATLTFGDDFLKTLILPFFSLSRIYNAPILERVDVYVSAIWFIPLACAIRTYIFAMYDGMQKVYKLKKTRSSYSIFFVTVLLMSFIIKSFNQVLYLIDIINMLGIFFIGFIILCLILSIFRKKGVVTNGKKIQDGSN